jgi:hypothetical protein
MSLRTRSRRARDLASNAPQLTDQTNVHFLLKGREFCARFERMMADIKVVPYNPFKLPNHSGCRIALSVQKRRADDDRLDSRLVVTHI